MRPLPELTAATEWFWTSGADGRLRIQGCTACGVPGPPAGPDLPELPEHGVGADGRSPAGARSSASRSTTIAGIPPSSRPTSIAVVALAEDPTVRLTTNIVGCDPAEVHVGQEVAVRFEHVEDVWLPLFEPTGGADVADPIGAARAPGAPGAAARRPLRAPRRAQRGGALGPRAAGSWSTRCP